jgi:AbrB family looped-hinge helix DNA binding protein
MWYKFISVIFCELGDRMEHERQIVRMSENGRLSIPAKQRKQLGLEEGGMVVTRVENGELRIRPVRAVLAEVQEKVSNLLAAAGIRPGTPLSEELIAGRREEAAREEAAREEPEYLESLKFRRAGDP